MAIQYLRMQTRWLPKSAEAMPAFRRSHSMAKGVGCCKSHANHRVERRSITRRSKNHIPGTRIPSIVQILTACPSFLYKARSMVGNFIDMAEKITIAIALIPKQRLKDRGRESVVLLHDEWCRRDIDKQYSHSETILQDVAYT